VDDRTVDADEPAVLRRRAEELEERRAALMAQTCAAVADAQERGYWLERWELDLDGAMRGPRAGLVRRVLAPVARRLGR
jgi:hypothetical protein